MIKVEDLKAGRYILDTQGNVSRIDFICECEGCKKRGFCEPRLSNGEYITVYDFKSRFSNYITVSDDLISLLNTNLSEDRLIQRLRDMEEVITNNNEEAMSWFRNKLIEFGTDYFTVNK